MGKDISFLSFFLFTPVSLVPRIARSTRETSSKCLLNQRMPAVHKHGAYTHSRLPRQCMVALPQSRLPRLCLTGTECLISPLTCFHLYKGWREEKRHFLNAPLYYKEPVKPLNDGSVPLCPQQAPSSPASLSILSPLSRTRALGFF